MPSDYKVWVPIVTATGVVISGIYLYGYWGSFDINILEFATFQDLVKLSIFPLVTGIFFLLIGVLHGFAMPNKRLPPGGGRNSIIGEFASNNASLLVWMWIIAIFLVSTLVPMPSNWIVAALMSWGFMAPISRLETIQKYVQGSQIKFNLLTLSFLVSTLAFAVGRSNAYEITTSPKLIIDVVRSKLDMTASKEFPIAYMGHINSFHVLYESSSKRVIFLPEKNAGTLYFQPSMSVLKSIDWNNLFHRKNQTPSTVETITPTVK